MRVSFFVFFNKSGYINKYIETLLDELNTVSDYIYFIVNGYIDNAEISKLDGKVSSIYIRDNCGYDGGAYSEYILNNFSIDDIGKCDEIIFCNDTFFGPFEPMTDIFATMESKECDYWGMRIVDRNLFRYVESYFIVFRKKILQEGALWHFLSENHELFQVSDYSEICILFERGLYGFFSYYGYIPESYAKVNRFDVFNGADINIMEYNLPILKKKIFDFKRYDRAIADKCVQFIQNNNMYDINLIFDFFSHEFRKGFDEETVYFKVLSKKEIEIFDLDNVELISYLENYKDIYIYGAGIIAGNIWGEYHYYIKNMKGFVISNQDKHKYLGQQVICLDDVPYGSNIIVALNRKNTREVIDKLYNKYNYLLLWNNL